jgi:hypothetical protein
VSHGARGLSRVMNFGGLGLSSYDG